MTNDSRDSTVIDLRRVDKLWGKGSPRFFICHSAKDKVFAQIVKEGLEKNGMVAFVAHTDIEPTLDWRDDIEIALKTTDVLVALLTENFRQSDWAAQEVGYALGQSKPIIPVTIEIDPYGMIGKYQALSGKDRIWVTLGRSIAMCFWQRRWADTRLETLSKDSYIIALERAGSFASANELSGIFYELDHLTPEQAEAFVEAFNGNGQVREAHGFKLDVAERLSNLSGTQYILEQAPRMPRRILKLPQEAATIAPAKDDLPF